MNDSPKKSATMFLQITKQIEPYAAKPYMLVETFLSCEGMRTRVCAGRWGSLEEAQAERDKKMERRNR